MVVLEKKCFKLPFVNSQTYGELMRLGLRYNREERSYSAIDLDRENADSVLELLSRILKDKVTFEETGSQAQNSPVVQTCVICGRTFGCDVCRYFELCITRDVTSSCVCGRCLEEGKPLA